MSSVECFFWDTIVFKVNKMHVDVDFPDPVEYTEDMT